MRFGWLDIFTFKTKIPPAQVEMKDEVTFILKNQHRNICY